MDSGVSPFIADGHLEHIGFFVDGNPAPQGSKTPIVKQRVGQKPTVVLIEGRGNQTVRHKAWRAAVKQAAAEAAAGIIPAPLCGPLTVNVVYRFQPSKVRERQVKESFDRMIPRVVSPDIDKLNRSTYDGLTDSGIILDDRYIWQESTQKVEVEGPPGALIKIWYVPTLQPWWEK
jgi:Holliday junction resolvase RusA-like endonuclease